MSRKDLYPLLKFGYENQKEAARDAKKLGYSYDNQLSNNETKVFVKDGKPTIVHRGSKRVKDWLVDDALILFGLEEKAAPLFNRLGLPLRSTKAKNITKQVEAKYGNSNALGHSLGGRLAENSGAHGNIITYNKAVGLGDVGTKKNSKRQLDVRAEGDVVSLLGHTQNANKETIKNKGSTNLSNIQNAFNAHKTDNLFNESDQSNVLFPKNGEETDLYS
jgi:hypothetical protein